jgi:peptidoglycan/LPS O-acetylase OafA/YrhL
MAVISVLAEHLLLALKIYRIGPLQVAWMGVVGVFVFFIHTALVLMWSMERRPHVLDFYIRRVFRIYPLAILAILAVLAFHAPVDGTPSNMFAHPSVTLHSLVANLTLTQNLFNGTLFESVMWSLSLEVQMYVLLPALFFYIQRNFAQWPLLILFALAIALTFHPPSEPTLISCSPYFLSGAIAYVGYARRKPTLPAWLLPCALLLVSAVFLVRPGFRSASILCLVIGAGLPSFRQIRSITLQRASHTVAKYSYGIYLAHPFAIVLGIYLLPHAPVFVQVTVVVLATAALSVAGYHLVEHPMIRLGSRLAGFAEVRYEQRELAHYRP